MISLFLYLRARLCERSTLADIIAGIGAAALLPWPWSLACLGLSLAKALIPDGHVVGQGRVQ
jgi:hypothetical protein